MDSRLFIGICVTGIVYADRKKEKHGDYAHIAFLSYRTLVLEWYPKIRISPQLRKEVLAHANIIIAQKGQDFQVSTSGQFVRLGE